MNKKSLISKILFITVLIVGGFGLSASKAKADNGYYYDNNYSTYTDIATANPLSWNPPVNPLSWTPYSTPRTYNSGYNYYYGSNYSNYSYQQAYQYPTTYSYSRPVVTNYNYPSTNYTVPAQTNQNYSNSSGGPVTGGSQ